MSETAVFDDLRQRKRASNISLILPPASCASAPTIFSQPL